MKIKSYLPKESAPRALLQARIDARISAKLRAKLKREGVQIRAFVEAAAEAYLNEK